MEPVVVATSKIYWISAAVAALIDAGLIAFSAWRIQRVHFERLRWPLVIAAMALFGGLWAWAMWYPFIWETCYQYVFPNWARYMFPPLMSVVNGSLALLFWWLARRLPGKPIFILCLLAGLESFPGHLWAIYTRGLLQTPLLKEVSAASALTFGFFEFIFYWCVILILASLLWRLWNLLKKPPAP